MDALIKDYARILSELDINSFNLLEDKYSGVFLPIPFEEYWDSSVKVMLIGRETAGWNTLNNKNTIRRLSGFIEDGNLLDLVSEATGRYRGHLLKSDKGKIKTTSRSRFKQYFFRLAKELKIKPEAMIYGNFFAWDYNKRTPRTRPENEFSEISRISQRLLAAQVKHLKPDVLIFATGVAGIDSLIKQMFNEHFGGYEKATEIIPGKYWEFNAANALCFRIAHPRATHGHGEFRDKVIQRIKQHVFDES